ncbi:nudix hydrolase 2-like [Cryptomeria japonica]|uniref:nudix hydrolase 2-like n=1 Tax=Cryptomeria japonica TaxID=3369 RepID=UPI0027DA9B00|nr:nudix hydrolase 2-like [Cryptomeria japonica]
MAVSASEGPSNNGNAINDVETVLNDLSREEIHQLLKAREDRYDGVEVDVENMLNDVRRFPSSLKASLTHWPRQGKKGVWIKVAKEQAKLVPVAIEEGFWYHHAEPSYVMLVLWIPKTPCTIPDNASHQVGIAAFVYNSKGEVLVVQEKCGPFKDSGLWKMPTGRIKQIDTEFIQVVGFRDGHNAPFEKSDLLFVCMLKPISFDIVIEDSEISASKWMAIDKFAAQPKMQQSKLLKDMAGVCVANMEGRCKGFSAIEIPSRKPSAFYGSAINTE